VLRSVSSISTGHELLNGHDLLQITKIRITNQFSKLLSDYDTNRKFPGEESHTLDMNRRALRKK
jgi:hypothetical protein